MGAVSVAALVRASQSSPAADHVQWADQDGKGNAGSMGQP